MEVSDRIDAIYVLSSDVDEHNDRRKGMLKFKGFFPDIQQLIDALGQDLVLSAKNNPSSMSIVSAASSETDEPDVLFTYSKNLVDLLHRIDYDQSDRKDFCQLLREDYDGDQPILARITEFEEHYQSNTPIGWYTQTSYVHSVVSKALATFDIERMIRSGCFIRDIYQEIMDYYSKVDLTRKFIVYRGDGMTEEQFHALRRRKDGLVSFSNFLCTSANRDIALLYTANASGLPDGIRVLWEIEIDPTRYSVPFAPLNEKRALHSEMNEVLFSSHTALRMGEIKETEEGLWQIHAILTDCFDEQLNLYIHHIRNEIKDVPPRESLAALLFKMGRYTDATGIFQRLLSVYEANNDIKSSIRIYNNLGLIYDSMEDSSNALVWYNKALEHENEFLRDHPALPTICSNTAMASHSFGDDTTALKYGEKALALGSISVSTSSSSLITIHSNLGKIYESRGDYANALSHYKQAHEIEKTSLPPDDPTLTSSYNNFGGIYSLLGDYPTALSFYEKALETYSTYLPPRHPLIATAYNNVGYTNYLMGDHPAALQYYEEALNIHENNLPANQLALATTYNNIAMVHRLMDDYSTALSFYQKTLKIEEGALPAEHPSLASTYNNVGALHQAMGNLSDALALFEKTLDIFKSTLPPNHPSLATIHNNIGSLYDRMGDGDKALSCYETAVSILAKNSLDLANTFNNIGEVHRSRGNYNQALEFYRKSLTIEEEQLSGDHPTLASTFSNMAVALEADKQYEQAIDYATRAVRIFSQALGPDHPQTKANQRFLDTLRSKLESMEIWSVKNLFVMHKALCWSLIYSRTENTDKEKYRSTEQIHFLVRDIQIPDQFEERTTETMAHDNNW